MLQLVHYPHSVADFLYGCFGFLHRPAGRSDETNRALESKREMVNQIQDMQRKVENEQNGENTTVAKNVT